MKEVIEVIAKETLKCVTEGKRSTEIAESILNLHYPCKECDGTKVWSNSHANRAGICESCKGTGLGSKMLAVLDETQEMPLKNPCPCGMFRYPDGHKCNAEDLNCISLFAYQAQLDMIKAGWKKTKEVKA